MNRKTDQVRAAWAAGDKIRALRIAARFFDRSVNTKTFKRGMDAYNNPDFYRQLGKDSLRQPHWNCWLGNLACSPQPNPQPSDGRRLTPWRLSRAPGAGQLEEARSLRPPQFA